MKYSILALLFLAGVSSGQQQKHLTVVPLNGAWSSTLTANDIERVGRYPSTIHLNGGIEVKTYVCRSSNGKRVCDGYTILRADTATYHEDTGEIEANGSVSISPLLHDPARR